jgi:hypothetical protein
MVKKAGAIFLLLIYGLSTMGITVNLHYCMNEYAGWSWGQKNEGNACGQCGMKEKKDGCCKNEQKEIKLKNDHQKGSGWQTTFFLAPVHAVQVHAADNSFLYKATVYPLHYHYGKWPPGYLLSRQILYCVFRI